MASALLAIDEWDKYIISNELEKALKIVLPFKDGDDDEVLWRLAYVLYYMTYNKKTTTETKRMIAEALCYSEKALEINEKNPEAHKTIAAVLDAHYKNISLKARLEHGIIARKHILRAAELNPQDPDVHYMLGLFCFNAAGLPWPAKKLLEILFSFPANSTFEDALNEFEKVFKKDTTKKYRLSKSVLYMIGHCHLKIGNKDKAVEYLKKSLQISGESPSDLEAQHEATKLLKNLRTIQQVN